MKKHSLFSGAIILTAGSVIAKLFSAIYRIILTNILGGEGIGLYQLVFPFYSLCVVLSTAGLPLAVSKLISRHKDSEKSILKKCLFFVFAITVFLSFLFAFSSSFISSLQGEQKLRTCYILLSPTLVFVGISSVLRGYFQGKKNFYPSAVSNILEQFVKMLFGLILSVVLINVSLFASVVGAIIGIVLSELGSFFVMFVYLKRNRPVGEHEITIEYKDILKEILPFATTSLILPISSFIDSLLVVNLLEINFNGNVPTFLYGLESGAVSSLVSLPTIVSFSVASVILPNITLRERKFNRDKNLANALKIVLVITVPCVLCFLLFPNRLVALLYGTKFNITNINGTILASRLIAISGIGVLFLAVNQIFSMCLQGVDMRFNAVRNIIIAVVGKFVIECLFLPSKQLNIYALAVANTTCYLLAMVLNYFDLKTSFKIKIDYMFWVKLLIANIIMLIFAIGTFSVEITNLNTILGLIVAVIVYLLMLYYLNIIGKDKAMIKYKI